MAGVVRALLAFALVLFVTTAGAFSIPMDADGTEPSASKEPGVERVREALAPFLPTPSRHPLARMDPERLLEELRTTSLPKVIMAQFYEYSMLPIRLVPLGDVDADGRGDYILTETKTYDEETLTIISGQTHKPLWSRALAGETWYVPGDVDGDGSAEIVLTKYGDEQAPGQPMPSGIPAGAGRFREVTPIKYEVVAGSTGTTLFERETEAVYEGTYASGSGVVVYASASTSRFEFRDLVPLEGATGMDLVTLSSDSARAWSYAGAGSLQVYGAWSAVAVERLDGAGKTVWTYAPSSPVHGFTLFDDRDYDGDRLPDLLVASNLRRVGTYTTVGAPSVDRPRVLLVSGETGSPLWEHDADLSFSSMEVLPGALLAKGGRTVLVHEWGTQPGTVDEFSTRILELDGKTGTPLGSALERPNEYAFATGFDDVNGDGEEELALVTMPSGHDPWEALTIKFAVTDRRLDAIWTISTEYDYWVPLEGLSIPRDFDGDGVIDLPVAAYDGQSGTQTLRVHSGATGRDLWTLLIMDSVVGTSIVDDVDGDGGADVAFVLFESSEQPAPAPPGRMTASTLQPSPVSRNGEDEDLAEQAGHLEVRSGRDAGLVWRAQVNDANASANFSALWAHVETATTLDTNGDGHVDLLVSFGSGFPWDAAAPEPNETGGPTVGVGEAKARPPLNFALVVDGTNGRVLHGYGPTTGVLLGEPLALSPPGGVSAVSLVAGLVALAAVACLRRRT